MKNAKQWLSVILSIVVVFTMALTPAMAAGTDNGKATITVETVQKVVKAGEEVTLNVSIAGNPGFAAFDFTVKYDAGKLELTKAEKGNIEGSFTGNKDTGKVNLYVAADKKEYTEDGVLFSLTFNVKADCADGAQVTLNTTTFKNAQGDKLSPTIVAGGINATTGGSTTGGTGSTTGGTGSTTGGTGSTTGGTGSTTGGTGSTTGGTGSTTGGTGSTTGGTGSTTGGTGSTTGGTGSTTGGTGSTTGGTGSTTGGTGSTTGGTGSTTGGTGSTTGGTGSTTGGTGSTGGGSTGGGSTGGGSSSGSGSGSSYTSGMSFTTDLPADSITRVTVNGKKLDSKYYTVSSNGSGSIVTLTDAYLATLKAGTYTIKIENATHVSTGTFTIKADGTPKTADAGIALYAVMAVSSLMGTAVVSKKCRKA